MRSLFSGLAASLILVSVALSLAVFLIVRRAHDEPMWGVLASIAAGLGAALIAVRIVTRSLERLRHTMEAFKKSGYAATERYREGGKHLFTDEVDRLAESFYSMAGQIASRID